MGPIFCRRVMGTVALLILLVGSYAGDASAQAPKPCLNTRETGCTKEIRVYNNLGAGHTMYVVWQGSKILQPAINCPLTTPGTGGDVWLQRALDDTTQCFAINNTYY